MIRLATPTRRLPRLAAIDVTLAALVALGSALAVSLTGAGERHADTAAVLLAALTGLPLAVHRRWPLPVLLVVAASAAVLQARRDIPQVVGPRETFAVTLVAAALAVLLTAVRSAPRSSYLVLVGTLVTATVLETLLEPANPLPAVGTVDAVLIAAWLVGAAVHASAAGGGGCQEQAEQICVENVEAAISQERDRIAAELHDIVVHSISLMVIQAAAADRVHPRDADRTHELHAAIERTGRAAVAELRGLLDLLRASEETAATGPPYPSIGAIPRLLDAVADAGLHVDLTTTGTPRPLPAGVELTVYRVVQEALTNILKHCGRTVAALSIAWQSDRLTVEVSNDGRCPAEDRAGVQALTGGGRGLVGMRERVTALGGAFHAGPRPDGGFHVRAVLPLSP